MTKKVLFVDPAGQSKVDWELDFVKQLERSIQESGSSHYEVVKTPEEADFIIFVESQALKTWKDIPAFKNNSLLQQYPNKVFTFNMETTPAGFLQGIYFNLPKRRFNTSRHIAWKATFMPYPNIVATEYSDQEPHYLFSFRGGMSNPIRKKLLSLEIDPSIPYKLMNVQKWYTHTSQEQVDYVRDIRNSAFVLCPAGLAPASHRIFEVMALGRVPVIIADQWVCPTGIGMEDCIVRIAEADIEKMPTILLSHRDRATAMGRAARTIWEQYFALEVQVFCGPRCDSTVDRAASSELRRSPLSQNVEHP